MSAADSPLPAHKQFPNRIASRQITPSETPSKGPVPSDSSEFYGIEIAGLGSAVREDMWGWQIGLGANFARRVHGFQTALLFNMTEELRGAQLGLVNYASTCSAGFQIGLVNLIMDNKVPFIPIFNCYF